MSITCLIAIAFPPVQVGCSFAEAHHFTDEGLDGLLPKILKSAVSVILPQGGMTGHVFPSGGSN
jgi:hypothetical protein